MRLAITTDWLVTKGGAERVIAEMQTLWPDAPLYTTVQKEGVLTPPKGKIRTSSLQSLYRLLPEHRILIPFMPRAVESWDLSSYEVVVSSSHAVAKGCIPGGNAVHICYCHTPMRYAWEMEEAYLDDFKLWGPLRILAQYQLRKLRAWDLMTAKRVDQFIANSNTVKERIRRIYGRDSIVLTPPVSDRFLQAPLEKEKGGYFLIVGRLVPYKHFDIAIEAANRLKLPLKIVGGGSEEGRLRRIAGPTVEFLGHAKDDDLPALYGRALATLFPVHEDAGIVPLESMASGTPVIALKKGGALDTVIEGKTGLFFDDQSVESLVDALQRFRVEQFDQEEIRNHAKKFSSGSFREALSKIVESTLALHHSR